MIRDVDVREISDGRFYRSSDLVRIGTGGCEGCSACCHDMGDSIVLDPYDLFRFERYGELGFDSLLAGGRISLSVIDGLVLPCLCMAGPENACTFLSEQGRCSIHAFRPGFCRLFPLGRYYRGDSFSYILQIHECARMRTKIRIRTWLEEPALDDLERFVIDWHRLLRDLQALASQAGETTRHSICMKLLALFYRCKWDLEEPFFPQFDRLYPQARQSFGLL